jgi:uncharacterized protein (TIGR04255 family)
MVPSMLHMLRSTKMQEGREPEAVVYPHAPLRAVAVEVRFSPLLDAFARFGAFQRRHNDDFGHVYEVSGDDRENLPKGREFARARSAVLMGNERAVSVATDQLAVVTYKYPQGFNGFRSWALPLLREGLGDLGVERINGVSFRYENRINHDTHRVDLGSVLKISLSPPAEALAAVRHLHLYWHQKWPKGTVEVAIEGCPHVSGDELHLDITAHCKTEPRSLDGLDALVRDAHRIARLTFEELITTSFHDSLRAARN